MTPDATRCPTLTATPRSSRECRHGCGGERRHGRAEIEGNAGVLLRRERRDARVSLCDDIEQREYAVRAVKAERDHASAQHGAAGVAEHPLGLVVRGDYERGARGERAWRLAATTHCDRLGRDLPDYVSN